MGFYFPSINYIIIPRYKALSFVNMFFVKVACNKKQCAFSYLKANTDTFEIVLKLTLSKEMQDGAKVSLLLAFCIL